MQHSQLNIIEEDMLRVLIEDVCFWTQHLTQEDGRDQLKRAKANLTNWVTSSILIERNKYAQNSENL